MAGDAACPRCGSILEGLAEGMTAGVRCPACGWSVVTTNQAAPIFDETVYRFSLRRAEATTDAIRLVAALRGIGILDARAALRADPDCHLFQGRARDITPRLRRLRDSGLPYRSEPAYPY